MSDDAAEAVVRDAVNPGELRAKADELFAATHHPPGARLTQPEVLIGEMPFGAGQVLTIVSTRTATRSFVRVRAWAIRPDGGRVPLKGVGISFPSDGLPLFAALVALALEREIASLPEWAQARGLAHNSPPQPGDSVESAGASTSEGQR